MKDQNTMCEAVLWQGMEVEASALAHYRNTKKPVVTEVHPDGHTLMSCNVRYLTPLDQGERSWFFRASLLMEDIASAAPGIIGFQEVTRWQYAYLVDCLTEYASTITYRDDAPASEGCPVFYDTRRYTAVDKGSFWLSETPDVISKGWGAACYRICSYVILMEKESNVQFVVFNTHLDHVSQEARVNGLSLILEKIKAFGGLPSVLMGDFNAEPSSATYANATTYFHDAAHLAGDPTDTETFQNWGKGGCRIDYFMVSKTGITVEDYAVISPVHNGVYASDHNPIVIRMRLN